MGTIEFPSLKNRSAPIDEGITKKYPGMSNLRVLLVAGYGINDTSFLSTLGFGTLTGLRNLQRFYLSTNDFNSTIFSSLKHLFIYLLKFTWNHNSLNGTIPVGLLELHSLAIFSVGYNNLSGAVPPFKAQFSTFDKSSYQGNPLLCGYPLDNECNRSKSSNTSSNGSEESVGFTDTDLFYISFVVFYGAILLGIAAVLGINPYWRTAWFRLVEVLMLSSYYFLLDNVVTPIKNRWWRNLG